MKNLSIVYIFFLLSISFFYFSNLSAATPSRLPHSKSLNHSLMLRYSAWSDWESLGGDGVSAPTSCSWSLDHAAVFVQRPDKNIWQRTWNENHWSDWESVGGPAASAPTALCLRPGQLSVYIKNQSGHLLVKKLTDGTWSDWTDLGGPIEGRPVLIPTAADRMELIVRRENGSLWHIPFQGRWGAWQIIGNNVGYDPAGASWSPGRLDVIATANDQTLWHRWVDGNQWSTWEKIEGTSLDTPALVAPETGRLELFIRGTDNKIYQKSFHASSKWSEWVSLDGNIDSGISATRVGEKIWLFGRSTDGALWYRRFE